MLMCFIIKIMISRQHPLNNNLDFRKRQIDTLKVFNHNVSEVNENHEYCVPFESAGRTLRLNVQLGANFPFERPKLYVRPTVQHHWVNATTSEVETAPGLLNYSQHSDLGRIVQAIVREFERFPPTLIEPYVTSTTMQTTPTATPPVMAISSIGGLTTASASTPIKIKQQQHGQLQTAKSLDSSNDIIECSISLGIKASNESCLPNLSTLSLGELKQLDTDPDFFDDFIEEMSVVQYLNEELDSVMNQVENISRENETKGIYLVELKRRLSDDYTALKNLGEKCDQLNKKYFKKSEEYAPQHIRELLQIAVSNADTDCDRHVELFLNGKIDVQTFLNNYTRSKKISAERKAKEERLGTQLSALERAGILN